MGKPPEPENDSGTSLPPSHAGQWPTIQYAHGVHPGGQTGHAFVPFPIPPRAFPAGQRDEQSPGPTLEDVLGGTAETIAVSTNHGGCTQATTLPTGKAEVSLCHHRLSVGGLVASGNAPHHSQARRWER